MSPKQSSFVQTFFFLVIYALQRFMFAFRHFKLNLHLGDENETDKTNALGIF